MKTRTQVLATFMFIIAFVIIAPYTYALDTTQVSVNTSGVQANNNNFNPALNENGQFVVFHSFANNLVAGDTNGVRDVFVHNRQTGQTTRASVATGGTQGNNTSRLGDLSHDGNLVSFESEAINLVAGDTNLRTDIFVHDRGAVTTTRVSVVTGGGQSNGDSFSARLSGDGRFVAFESEATNLDSVLPDTNGVSDIFVHDRQMGITTRVSLPTGGGVQANDNSFSPAISANGRWVAFESEATNLVAGDTNLERDIFVHDRDTGTTMRVSVPTGGGVQANDDSYLPDISEDGRFVAFESDASNLVAGDTNGWSDVFHHDRQTGTTIRISVWTGGALKGNDDSFEAAISGDGRFVAFLSFASNLVPGDTNGEGDVFLHDTQAIITTRMSVGAGGEQGNDFSCNPAISHDGRVVGFFSDSTNLVPGGSNGLRNIFVRDSWQIAGIGDLNANPTADVVWRNPTTGTVSAWFMNGLDVSGSAVLANIPTNWVIGGVGDLDNNGTADVIWRNPTTGTVAAWYMTAGTGAIDRSAVLATGLPAAWIIEGVGDLDGNGTADVVWRNPTTGTVAAWYMTAGTGAVAPNPPMLATGLPAAWIIGGVGDLDNNGTADVIWRNPATGTVAAWYMTPGTGAVGPNPSVLATGLPAAWIIGGIGDLDNNGTADVVWHNTTTGTVAAWLMTAGTGAVGSIGVISTIPTEWIIAGMGDLNNNGTADVIWHRPSSGTTAGWLMNGLTVSESGIITASGP